ncbi:MAG: phosphoribosylformylglycinamidine synthase subunit PurQ [Planctomycetota bacterium]
MPVAQVRVIIVRAAGINCDLETQYAWELAGARAERVHVRQVIDDPGYLETFQILTIPGGFSYGDDIAAGRILAAQLRRHLLEELRGFLDRGGLILGICNGFQVLVRAGLLPFGDAGAEPVCTITYNEPAGFQDRWVNLRAMTTDCAFLEPGREYEMPIAHGEGRVLFADAAALERAVAGGHNALTYVSPPTDAGVTPGAPDNPNGSDGDIAGLTDETGRVLGLMPHPERFVAATQHPAWTSCKAREEGDGLALFRRALAYLR